MLYDTQNAISELVGVYHMRWSGGSFNISPRPYSALAFRIKGDALITAKNKSYNIGANDILYLPQNLPYTAEYSDTEIFVVHFKTVKSDGMPEVYTLKNSERIYRIFLKMNSLWENKTLGYIPDIISLIYSLLGEISRAKSSEKYRPEFLKAVSFMNANFKNNDICVPQICNAVGIGQTVFRQMMKAHYQKSPVEYIIGLRLEYARNLISCGIPVEQAAFESGFNDSKYFARAVKKHFGCTARELKTFGK